MQELTRQPSSCVGHKEVSKAIARWVGTKLRRSGHLTCSVTTEKSLKDPFGVNQLWLTELKRVDVAATKDDIPVVQFEVESGHNRDATVRKLSYGLVDQLRYLKNRRVQVNEIIGFYVPIGKGYVEKVACNWDDAELVYIIKSTKLEFNSVEDEINSVYARQSALDPRDDSTNFLLPLTPSYIRSQWDVNAYQQESGASVVIVSPGEGKGYVYKRPLRVHAIDTLQGLLVRRQELFHSVLPIDHVIKGQCIFFKFHLCLPPLSRGQAKVYIAVLVCQVVNALNELHQAGLAHLDIRLENICFSPETQEALLIDLDRCSLKDREAEYANVHGKSTMYSQPSGSSWKAFNLDWRQLGIMIKYILKDPPIDDYHSITVDSDDDAFLFALFNEG